MPVQLLQEMSKSRFCKQDVIETFVIKAVEMAVDL